MKNTSEPSENILKFIPKQDSFSFETCATMMIIETNSSWNLLESPWWKRIVIQYCARPFGFGSHAAKNYMVQINTNLKMKILNLLSRIPYYSISEDEGTITGFTKVLHNIHVFDPHDFKYKTFFLRYFETQDKKSETLTAHWDTSFSIWNIKKDFIASFVSDQALAYVPNSFGFIHIPCGVHLLDLSLEDNYDTTINEEVKKLKKIREFITSKTSIEQKYFEYQYSKCQLPTQSFPINSLVRFVTHQQVFDHVCSYWKACNAMFIDDDSLILKESEILTLRGCSIIFNEVRTTMLEMQSSMCCKYFALLYGLIISLKNLPSKQGMKEIFTDAGIKKSTQDLLRLGIISSIERRICGIDHEGKNSQLTKDAKTFLIKSMLMEPYLKSKIDVKFMEKESKIFPQIIRNTTVEDAKKQLIKELEIIIKINKKNQDSIQNIFSDNESPLKKKKKDVNEDFNKSIMDNLESDTSEEEDVDEDIIGNNELKWFKKNYLQSNVGIKSLETSEAFWKEKKKDFPYIIKLLCKYRSVACTSIFEEQCFSSINKIVTLDRESMLDKTVEAMMFFKKNFPYFPE